MVVASQAQFDGLFIATPERVSFSYQLAGLGSRFLALFLDSVILAVVLTLFSLVTVATGLGGPAAAVIVFIAFTVIFNVYFIFFEGLWSGQTPGKKAARLRAVGSSGQPITFEQALMRNLVRNLDFLPFLYGIGIVALFVNGRGQRLGDLAAGTVVVRERASLSLSRLVAMAEQTLSVAHGAPGGPNGAPATEAAFVRQRALRDLEPPLRDFVTAYAARRPRLAQVQRESLAESARAGLARALPSVVAAQGPLAALEHLADQVAGAAPSVPGARPSNPSPPATL
ncbi:MAG: RDD family protein [Candidatus Dormibacteria bacterium]